MLFTWPSAMSAALHTAYEKKTMASGHQVVSLAQLHTLGTIFPHSPTWIVWSCWVGTRLKLFAVTTLHPKETPLCSWNMDPQRERALGIPRKYINKMVDELPKNQNIYFWFWGGSSLSNIVNVVSVPCQTSGLSLFRNQTEVQNPKVKSKRRARYSEILEESASLVTKNNKQVDPPRWIGQKVHLLVDEKRGNL